MTTTTLTAAPVAPDAADLPRLADALRAASRRAAADLILIGVLLGRVRAALPRGAWVRWCEAELGWSAGMVYRLLQVGEAFGGLTDARIGRIEPSALYALSQPGVPPSARAYAVELAADGGRVTRAVARDILDAYRRQPDPAVPPPTRAEAAAEAPPPAPAGPDAQPLWAAFTALLAKDVMVNLSRSDEEDGGEPVYTGRVYRPGERAPRVAVGPDPGGVVLRLAGREPAKACIRCRRERPVGEFPKNARSPGGRLNACRACERQRLADYRARKLAAAGPATAAGAVG